MGFDVAQWLSFSDEFREQREQHDVLEHIGMVARVVSVLVAQHYSIVLDDPPLRPTYILPGTLEAGKGECPRSTATHTDLHRPAAHGDRRLRARIWRRLAEARRIARYCLMDTLGCGMLGAELSRLHEVARARRARRRAAGRRARAGHALTSSIRSRRAFNIGAMVRWLDFNDTWLAAEWGHPSDNLGAILAVADYLSRRAVAARRDAADGPRRADRDDQGARNPGRPRAGEQLQPRRPRSRAARARRVTAVATRDARRHARTDRQRASRTRGSTAARCAPIGTRRTPARARAGPRAMRRAARVRHALIALTRRDGLSVGAHARRRGASRTCCSRASRSRSRSRSAAT